MKWQMPLFVVSCFFFRCLIAFRFCHSCDLESFIPLASRELSYLNIDRLHHVMFMLCFMPSLTNYWNCCYITLIFWASLVTQVVKNTASMGSIPGLGRFPRDGNGNPLQCSCLENSMDRGAWQATVHGVTKSWTQLCD